MFLTGKMGFKKILIFISECSNILFCKKKNSLKRHSEVNQEIKKQALHKISCDCHFSSGFLNLDFLYSDHLISNFPSYLKIGEAILFLCK